MRKSILFTLIVMVPLISACCPITWPTGLPSDIFEQIAITGSGNVVTREENLSGFDKVDVSHAFAVDISQGDSFSVVIRIDDNVEQYLEVVKQGSTLKIGLKPGRNYGPFNATLEAEVTMPELTGLYLSGASHAMIAGFESTKAFDVEVSGASSLRGDIEAGDATFDVSGAGQVTLTGSAQDLRLDASGASDVDLADFPVGDARLVVSGASRATVYPSGTLDADASGASHVSYLGNPTLGRVETSGGASVEGR